MTTPMIIPIAAAQETAADTHEVTLTKQKEMVAYICFVVAVVGMILQSVIGDAGYAITGLAVAGLLVFGVMDFNEIRNAISAPKPSSSRAGADTSCPSTVCPP
ncbi:hypothetical protein [Faecalibacterium sp. An58]|uniref:hypothetical protein n=1 Tax=Faecalibacterium sp. An58 TaxID=1965648 RepID=UPI001FA8F17A|nr:hypothetical protein [Faecalibacterium sp. An58]